MKVERISTGIKGLDAKMKGGYVKGSVNLISGRTGTGKSAFCSSFIWDGLQKNEPCTYITTEQRAEELKVDLNAMFGWDFSAHEKKKMMNFVSIKPIFPGKSIDPDRMNKLIKLYVFDISEKIEQGIKLVKAKRVVLDSISLIEMFIKDPYLSRTVLMHLIEKMKDMGTTALLTGTIPETSEGLSGGGIVEYIVDSVTKLDFVPVAEEYKRTLTIRKMRRTDHSSLIHPFSIEKSGLKVIEIK